MRETKSGMTYNILPKIMKIKFHEDHVLPSTVHTETYIIFMSLFCKPKTEDASVYNYHYFDEHIYSY